MPKAVIFDIDGTLVDSVALHAHAWVEAFKRHGYEVDFDDVKQHIGKGGEHIVAAFVPEAERERVTEDISGDRKSYYQKHLLPQVQPFPQVRSLFERLKADGIRVVLASSGRRESVDHNIKLLEVADLIDGSTSTDDAEQSKPEPDIFEAALHKLAGISPDEALVVGDSPYDAEAAGKIPIRTIGVLCGGFSESVLKEAGCIAIYRDPADLLNQYPKSLSV
ncbi:MAG: HAD family hydrolase [Synechococcales bacterium]|nr:HAD family hydrolase [Synechococcales bacterium]